MENQSDQSQNDIVQGKKKDNKDSLEIYLVTEEAVKTERNETYRKQIHSRHKSDIIKYIK